MWQTYATWNPSDKHSEISLSNGNLTAAQTADNWRSVRSTISVTSGKWYRETKLDAGATNWHIMTGVANGTAALTNYISVDTNWWVFYEDAAAAPYKWNNGFTWYWSEIAAWDIIWVALDMDNWTITFYKNNTSMTQAFTWISGTIYPALSLTWTGSVSTANFGATTMAYTAPSGYNQWLYTSTSDLKTVVWLAKASVKTVNWLAIASVKTVNWLAW